ncbi:MAG: DUF983 domain-containing protein [Alphaproteobacteria bacterium]|nr:DUF983 domain-containing protein [Alphaproteobacteria bacterium]
MLSLTQVFGRAVLCRCPRCAGAGLFKGFLALKPACTACGLPLQRADSGDGPAVILTFALGFFLIPPILVFALHSDWPMWLHSLVWSLVILGATLGSVRPAKALMVGLQYRTKPEMFEG